MSTLRNVLLVVVAIGAGPAVAAYAQTGQTVKKKQPTAVTAGKVTPAANGVSTAAAASASALSAAAPLATAAGPASTSTPLLAGTAAVSEIATRADSILKSMQRRAQEVALILRVARSRDDKTATACANDALNRANMSVRLGREKAATIGGFAKVGANEEAERNMRLLEELSSTQSRTTEFAGSCIGQVSRTVQEKTDVKVEKPAGVK